MSLKIDASDLFVRHYLTVSDQGVVFCHTTTLGGVHTFRFDQIDAVLSGEGKLSIQANGATFTISMNAADARHRVAVARLVAEARRTLHPMH